MSSNQKVWIGHSALSCITRSLRNQPMKKCLLNIIALLITTTVTAQIPNLLIYDKTQTQQFGAANLNTLHKLSYKIIDQVIPAKIWDESKPINKIGGIGYRAVKLGIIGFQLDVNTVLYQHEVFGHGSRMREFEYENINYRFNHFFPFGFGGSASGSSTFINSATQGLMRISGGVEGDLRLSEQLEESILASSKLHYRQSSLFLISRNNLLRYARSNLSGNGDISSYVSSINSKYNQSSSSISVKNIFNQALTVLLNPLQFYALLNLSKDYLFNGDSSYKEVKFININQVQFLPSINYNLTPFGGEYIINNYFKRHKKLLLLRVKIGDNTFANYYGGNLKILNLIYTNQVRANVGIGFWNQPKFLLGTASGLIEKDDGFGYVLKGSVSYFPVRTTNKIGIYGQVGYKTSGYLMGEMLQKGIILRVGMAIDFSKGPNKI